MKTREYSQDIAQAVRQYMEKDNLKYSFHEETGVFQFGMKISGKLHTISCLLAVGTDEYQFMGICPLGVDVEDANGLADMALFLARVNHGLKNGSFQLDCEDGEIRYYIYVDCDGRIPTVEKIRKDVTVTCLMFSRFAEGITGILYGGLTPEEAESCCEPDGEMILRLLREKLRELQESREAEPEILE